MTMAEGDAGADDGSRRLMEQTDELPMNIRASLSSSDREDSLTSKSHAQVRKLLYISHFLSTWNSRAFEFGAFLFLATIYPQTLLPASIYALARAGSAATLSPWIGGYLDHTERLSAVRVSIIGQRVAVAASCAILFGLTQFKTLESNRLASYGALALLSALACVEKLSAVMNTISVERDWVVIIAQDDEVYLTSTLEMMRYRLIN